MVRVSEWGLCGCYITTLFRYVGQDFTLDTFFFFLVLTSYLFYTYINSVYMSIPIFQFSFPPSPLGTHNLCSLHLCLYFHFANKFIWIIFLDSTHKQCYMIFDGWFHGFLLSWECVRCHGPWGPLACKAHWRVLWTPFTPPLMDWLRKWFVKCP